MEAERRSKRKPLSDCTNILPNSRKKPQSSTLTKKPISKTLIKPPKPSNSTPANVNKDAVNVPTNSSKSHTSIGSNNSSDSVTVPSVAPPSAPPTPVSNAGERNSENSGLSADQSQRHDATRTDKGKTIAESPTISSSAPAHKAPEPRQVASSSSPYYRHDATQRKDKGKMVADIPFIPFFTHMPNRPLRISSPSSPPRYEIQGVQSQNLHVQTIKDKGKTTVDASLISKQLETSSDTSGRSLSGKAAHSQNWDEETRKEKEKTFLDIPNIEKSERSTPHSYKRTTIVDASLISKQLETSSDTSGRSLSGKAAHSQNWHEETRKEKEKTFLDSPNIKESEPSTPHSSLASPAASGTLDGPLTVYSQRRIRHGRKHAAGKINLSSHSEQRTRKTGLEVEDGRSNKKGSHTDPLPVHKKKRSHGKHDAPTHAMPQEEIEKLRAYYADIDAFELPEEVASENDLD